MGCNYLSLPLIPASDTHVLIWDFEYSCLINTMISQLLRYLHYCDVIMSPTASQITSLTTVYSTVYSDTDQRKHQSSASLAFVRGIHRRPGNSPHKWPVTQKMFPFDDVIMSTAGCKGIGRQTDIQYSFWLMYATHICRMYIPQASKPEMTLEKHFHEYLSFVNKQFR